MFISCDQDEPLRSPIKVYFSCVISIYFVSFFYEHPVDHFLRNFCKKCISTIENPKKKLENFSKNDKTTFKQANFCLLRCQILPRHGLVTLVCIYEA